MLESFFRRCPAWADDTDRARFEQKLAAVAARDTPETLRRTIDETLYLLNQDGPAPDDGKRRRGIHMGPQDIDGTSALSGRITAELRAGWEAVFAKLAAPAMANPADEHPRVSGIPTDEQITADTRLPGQRRHDALWAMTRDSLASGVWGQHNGLPVSIVITTTLAELEARAGIAVTTTGTRQSIPQVIGLAAKANQYLAVFAEHTNIPSYLGRARRTATTGQRLMLFARDRGCTRPGCTASADRADRAQAHHAQHDFAQGGRTDIDELALGCGPDQRLVGPGKWSTRINAHGRCERIPPDLLDTGQNRINQHHHPHLTHSNDEGDDETDCLPS